MIETSTPLLSGASEGLSLDGIVSIERHLDKYIINLLFQLNSYYKMPPELSWCELQALLVGLPSPKLCMAEDSLSGKEESSNRSYVIYVKGN